MAGFDRTIGILGGVGPAATAYAHERLIGRCQEDYGAIQDSDFPDIVITSFPIRGMNEKGFDGEDEELAAELERALEVGCETLLKAGASLVYMACNTLHQYGHVLANSGLEEVNMIQATADHIAENWWNSSVAVLGSDATRRERLYATALGYRSIDYREISDDDQALIDGLILGAMGGRELEKDTKRLENLCERIKQDVDIVVIGCTELSLLLGQHSIMFDCELDAQEVALTELLRRARSEA